MAEGEKMKATTNKKNITRSKQTPTETKYISMGGCIRHKFQRICFDQGDDVFYSRAFLLHSRLNVPHPSHHQMIHSYLISE